MTIQEKESLEAYFSLHGFPDHALKAIIEKVIDAPDHSTLTGKEESLIRKSGVKEILDDILKELRIETKPAS